mmetsp:Transcript_7224/g.10590  ORF Transcript_7224/g.10590 Transcript_7224/m.10590 type:complete len:89 (+) Transcript_7224:73-339(+)
MDGWMDGWNLILMRQLGVKTAVLGESMAPWCTTVPRKDNPAWATTASKKRHDAKCMMVRLPTAVSSACLPMTQESSSGAGGGRNCYEY